MPTSGKDEEFNSCLDDLVSFLCEYKMLNDMVIIGMDSNCSDNSSARRKDKFENFCKEQNLVKISIDGNTFHHNNGLSHSNIDYFLVSELDQAVVDMPRHKCTALNSGNFSTHDPVFTTLRLPSLEINTVIHIQDSISRKSPGRM